MQGDEVALRHQSPQVLHVPHPVLGRPLLRQVRAPGGDVHAEGEADPGHPGADLPEADEPQGPAGQVGADGGLPRPALPHRPRLGRHVPGQAEQQRPGQLGRRRGRALRAADGDAPGAGGGDVDRGVAQAGGDQEPQPGQPVEERRVDRRPLPHDDQDLAVPDGGDQRVPVVEVLAQDAHLDAAVERAPVGGGQGDALVVVEYGAAQLHGGMIAYVPGGGTGRTGAGRSPGPVAPTGEPVRVSAAPGAPAGAPSARSTPPPPAGTPR